MRPILRIALILVAVAGVCRPGAPLAAQPAPAPAAPTAAPVATPAAATAPAPPPAAPAPQPPDPMAVLNQDQQTLVQLQNQLPTVSNDTRLAAMQARAAAIEASANQLAAGLDRQLAGLDRSLKRYPRRVPASQRAQVAALTASRNTLKAQLGSAQAVAATASAAYTLAAERRREGFSARVLEQSASPLSPDFWTSLSQAAGADVGRLEELAQGAADAAFAAPEPRAGLDLGIGLIVALILLFPARWGLSRLGRVIIARRAGRRPFGKSAYALAVTILDTALPTLAAVSVRLGALWGGLLVSKANALAGALVFAVAWAAAIQALGRALATNAEADYRLLDVQEPTARRMRPLLTAVAIITACGFLLSRINYIVGASVAATIAANCVVSLAYAGIAAAILISFGRSRSAGSGETADAAGSSIWTLVSLVLSGAIVVTVGAVFAGYTTLAALVSNQIFWLSLLAALTYLLLRLVDDLCSALFSDRGWAARTLVVLFNFRRSTIAQTGILISAALQVMILIGAVTLALTPFGESGDLFLGHLSSLGQAIHIGSASISPAALISGLAALVIGMGVVHMVRGWVVRRYLPVTDWDAGVRNSVSTGVGYMGVGIAILCALAAMGLGFAQIALIASALSVGIGFGLQQVVQNFISGVIVLVERPVKVGDWVKLDGVEGNIRRIRVRATDIETFDRTTVIVPNSDLITKQVENKTLGDPRGRIKLELAIAKSADAGRARDLVLQLASERSDVLKQPTPAVYVDSVAAGGVVNLVAHLFVANPRDVYRTRSELYFAVLEALQGAGIAI